VTFTSLVLCYPSLLVGAPLPRFALIRYTRWRGAAVSRVENELPMRLAHCSIFISTSASVALYFQSEHLRPKPYHNRYGKANTRTRGRQARGHTYGWRGRPTHRHSHRVPVFTPEASIYRAVYTAGLTKFRTVCRNIVRPLPLDQKETYNL
jgi:hypothetical protein